VITLEPYLIHYYHTQVAYEHSETKNFHLVGFDILLDTKLNAWLMEINANPSFNMFLERDLPGGEVEKTVSDLDKYVKSKVVSETIRIVTVLFFFNPSFIILFRTKVLMIMKAYLSKYYQITA
jgi:hypothetical protein